MIAQIQAIADPTRFAILSLLNDQELPAGQIAKNFENITRPAVSQHIRVLKDYNLLRERREGTKRYYSVDTAGFHDIRKLLEEFWTPRLQKLKTLAENEERTKQ